MNRSQFPGETKIFLMNQMIIIYSRTTIFSLWTDHQFPEEQKFYLWMDQNIQQRNTSWTDFWRKLYRRMLLKRTINFSRVRKDIICAVDTIIDNLAAKYNQSKSHFQQWKNSIIQTNNNKINVLKNLWMWKKLPLLFVEVLYRWSRLSARWFIYL